MNLIFLKVNNLLKNTKKQKNIKLINEKIYTFFNFYITKNLFR